MGQLNRSSRLREYEEIAKRETRGYVAARRGRVGIGAGTAPLFIVMIAALVITSGCSALGEIVTQLALDARSMDDVDGLCVEYRVVADDGDVSQEGLDQMRSITENRVNAFGIAEPIVRSRPSDHIEVALQGIAPGTEEADQVLGLIGTTGVLEFMPVPPEFQGWIGEGPLPDGMQGIEPLFTGVEIAGATIAQDDDTGGVVVDLQFKEAGARLFDEYAADHFGEQFAIVLDDEVMSAPFLNARRLGGEMQISDDFTMEEASELITVLRFGSLPLEITDVRAWACGGPPAEDTGQSVEVPEAAVTVIYPSDWMVELAPWDGYRPEENFVGVAQVMAHDPSDSERCDLFTQRTIDGSDVSLDDETEAFIERVKADPETRLLPTTTDSVPPMGMTSRVDFEGHGSSYAYWHVADGVFLHQLACSSADPPQDRWRSIASTLEAIAVDP